MNIVVVGGGTAGWLAALMISRVHPEHKLTVIESSAIGIIGAGEGSTGLLTSIIDGTFWDFGCNLMNFLTETGATLKYGIKHKDWTPNLGTHYIGPVGGSPLESGLIDYIFAYFYNKDPSTAHLSSEHGHAIEHNISNFNKKTFKFHDGGIKQSALHFDAHAVGKYFKKITLKTETVLHVDDEVVDVVLNEQGRIESLKLKSENSISGNFFIDASGFKQVLMKKLNAKWISYKENLPVNSAMPFILPFEDNEVPELYTTAWAQSSGWMWQIPTLHRKGCGYVFDDNFITADQAHAEIEKTLGRSIDPIRVLKFDTGRQENVWIKNCLSIGLSAAFAEPLEATSIHTTIIQLSAFIFEFLRPTLEDTLNPSSIDSYNRRIANLYDTTKEFLVAHYMGGRTDSEFWQYIASGATRTKFVDTMIKTCKSRLPTNRDLDLSWGAPDMGLWIYVLGGIGAIKSNVTSQYIAAGSPKIMESHNLDTLLARFDFSMQNIFKDQMSYPEFIKFLRYKNKE